MGWYLSFLNDFYHTHRVIRDVVGDFSFNWPLRFKLLSLLLFTKYINNIQWNGLTCTEHLGKATEHTCTLRRATNLIISKITKAS
jgi:hypothetical protein